MTIMSTPRQRERLNGRYISSVDSYTPMFFERLKEVTRNHPFWDPTPN